MLGCCGLELDPCSFSVLQLACIFRLQTPTSRFFPDNVNARLLPRGPRQISTMARRRRERSPSDIKLTQPDRSGPTEKTLLEIAQARGLFDQAKQREQEIGKKAVRIPRPRKDGDDSGEDDEDDDEVGLPPGAERVLETLLWSVSLSMLHVTLDVLVHQQYSVDKIVWPSVVTRFGQALLGKLGFPGITAPSRGVALLTRMLLCFQSSACSSTSSTPTPQTPCWFPGCLFDTNLSFARPYSSPRASMPAAT